MQPKAIINLRSFRHNINYIKSKLNSNTNIMPVVKANAYGHGYHKIVKILNDVDINCVCVATIDEAKQIDELNLGIDILHLGRICSDMIKSYVNVNIIATINSEDDIKMINKYKNGKIRCHIKVNTVMNRMGCDLDKLDSIINAAMHSNYIKLEGVYSHLASSYDVKSDHNAFQIKNFSNIIINYKRESFYYHLLSSGGMINFPEHHLDGVRCGLSLYGISPLNHINENLKPVMKFIAPIVLIKYVNKGDKIGYDCTYIVKERMKIALLQCGYADGIPLEFGNSGHVYYNESKMSILGKVSMDLICIDCTNVDIDLGEYVCIWGDEMNEQTNLNVIAKKFNSISYVYLTSVSDRVKRIYVDE